QSRMKTSTFSLLLMAAIGLLLIPGARAADDGAHAMQVPASDGKGQSTPAPASDNDVRSAASATSATVDGKRGDDSCNAPSKDCVAIGHWSFNISLGAGVRTDPVVHEAAIPLVVIPHFSYYGKRVFIEDLDLGFTLTESDASTLSLIATPGYDRVFFYRSDLQNIFVSGIPYSAVVYSAGGASHGESVPGGPRHWTYLAGPEWTFETHGITGQLDLLHEITAQNHGNEIRAALGIPLIESTGSLSGNVGLTWKSSAIVRYYYGVPGVYEGGAALNPFVKLGYSRPLSSKWRLTAFVHYEHLGSAITGSPIVNARNVLTVFAGATYAF
ncbi:MAG TPA: MipA/OmpV family protein, partial [Steroidobacteraceae bacterium]|nr:MipA/OmpV family protein [Steroidobacteraceae bacterium]